MFVRCVGSRSPRPASQPAPAGLGAFGPPVGVGVVVADALGLALGVGLHVILGIAVTGAEAFVYAVAVTLGNPGGVTVSLAGRLGDAAAVGPD